MRNRRINILMLALTLSLFSSCVSIDKDAEFYVTGKVTYSAEKVPVINSGESIKLCVIAEYLSDSNVSGYFERCRNVFTDQEGRYSFKVDFDIPTANFDKNIEIKDVRFFGALLFNSRHYYYPVNVVRSDLSASGGEIEANIDIFLY